MNDSTDATPRHIRAPAETPTGTIVLGVVGAGFLTVALVEHAGSALLALAQLIALSGWHFRTRRPALDLRVETDGLREANGDLIAWNELEAVRFTQAGGITEGAANNAALVAVFHPRGRLILPKRAEYDRDALLRELLEKSDLMRRPGRLPAALDAEYRAAIERFGPERVFATTSEARPIFGGSSIPVLVFFFSALLIACVAAAMAPGGSAGVACLFIQAFIAFIMMPVHAVRRRDTRIGLRGHHALLLTPEALFVETDDRRGKLAWRDVRDIGKSTRDAVSVRENHHGLRLRLHGATHVVRDIYRHPLYEIRRRVEEHLAAAKSA